MASCLSSSSRCNTGIANWKTTWIQIWAQKDRARIQLSEPTAQINFQSKTTPQYIIISDRMLTISIYSFLATETFISSQKTSKPCSMSLLVSSALSETGWLIWSVFNTHIFLPLSALQQSAVKASLRSWRADLLLPLLAAKLHNHTGSAQEGGFPCCLSDII